MTKAENTSAIAKKTGKSWPLWVKELDGIGARKMNHTDLARIVNAQLKDTIENHSWWAQAVTVAYEQHIGKRVPGQLSSGLFEFAVSKTIDVSRSDLFESVVKWIEAQEVLNQEQPLNKRSSKTPKRSNWRCDFKDGSKFVATVEQPKEKSKLVFTHTALSSKASADQWKTYWSKIASTFSNNK